MSMVEESSRDLEAAHHCSCHSRALLLKSHDGFCLFGIFSRAFSSSSVLSRWVSLIRPFHQGGLF
jgi:hypothetical protein